jgi:hypothetical protein
MAGTIAGAAWGAATGVPSATGAPIMAGAMVVVPHGEPRWSQLRKRAEQPVLAVVKTAKANRISIFLIF